MPGFTTAYYIKNPLRHAHFSIFPNYYLFTILLPISDVYFISVDFNDSGKFRKDDAGIPTGFQFEGEEVTVNYGRPKLVVIPFTKGLINEFVN